MDNYEKFTMLSNFPDILLILDKNQQIIYANKEASNKLQYSLEEFRKMKISKLLVNISDETFVHMFDKKLDNGYIMNLVAKQKQLVLGCVKFKHDDNFSYVVTRVVKRNQISTFNRYDVLINSAPFIMYITDNNHRIVNCNRLFLDLVEEKDKRFIIDNTTNPIIEKIYQSFGENTNMPIKASEEICNFHHSFNKNGQETFLNSTKKILYEGKKIVGMLVVMDDITDEVELSRELNKTSYLLKTILDNIPTAIFWKDRNAKIIGHNKYLKNYFNFSRHEHSEIQEADYYLSSEEQEIIVEDKALRNGSKAFLSKEKQLKLIDGQIVEAKILKVPFFVDKTIDGIIGIIIDLTSEKVNNAKISESNKLLEDVLEAIPIPIYWKDLDLNCLGCNQSYLNFLNINDKSQIIGKKSEDFYKHYNHYLMQELDNEVFKTGRMINSEEFELIDNNDIKKIIRLSKIPMLKNGKITGLISVLMDITLEEKYRKHLEFLSFHDGLTSLYNLAFFNEELLRLDSSRKLPISMVMIDVDGLKLFNDTFGHHAGDEMLIKVAKIIQQNCRHEDIIARIGGDEFAIVLPNTTNDKCSEIVQRILTESSNEKVNEINLSLSIGYATKELADQKLEDIMMVADARMYNVKLERRANQRLKMVKTIQNNLFKKADGEQRHSYNVGEIAYKIALSYGLSQKEADKARLAARLHDIGKIIMKKDLLNSNKTKLTNEEWYNIHRHSEIGYAILNASEVYSDVAKYVYYHHEHYDGTGYPKKLMGEEIPLIARIIHVADAIDAMNSNRPYRKALPRETILFELKNCLQFDSSIVKVAINLIENEHLID